MVLLVTSSQKAAHEPAHRTGWLFAYARGARVQALVGSAPSFFAELAWIEAHAPFTRKHILDPIFKTVLIEVLESVSARDIAFILGRTVRLTIAAGGTLA